jgi:hypothetical protein
MGFQGSWCRHHSQIRYLHKGIPQSRLCLPSPLTSSSVQSLNHADYSLVSAYFLLCLRLVGGLGLCSLAPPSMVNLASTHSSWKLWFPREISVWRWCPPNRPLGASSKLRCSGRTINPRKLAKRDRVYAARESRNQGRCRRKRALLFRSITPHNRKHAGKYVTAAQAHRVG